MSNDPHETRALRIELSIPVGHTRIREHAQDTQLRLLEMLFPSSDLLFDLALLRAGLCELSIRLDRQGLDVKQLGTYRGAPNGTVFQPLWNVGTLEFLHLSTYTKASNRPHQLRIALNARVRADA